MHGREDRLFPEIETCRKNATPSPSLLFHRLRQLRQPLDGCSYPEALATSWDQFLHVDNLTVEACSAERVPYAATLGYQCPLLARKFSPDVAEHIFGLMTDCSSRLNISRLMHC